MSSRSTSRGRPENLLSTGRGGAGNIRSHSGSHSRTREVDDGVTYSVERGRTIEVPHIARVQHSGRGGAGNIRSPSRDPQERERELAEQAYETQVIENRRRQEEGRIQSAGRGGVGNMRSRSHSRDPHPPSPMREPNSFWHDGNGDARGAVSSGRGGYGNQFVPTREPDGEGLRKLDEEDEKARASWENSHSTEPFSSGIGGAGNIHRTHTTDSTSTGASTFDEAEQKVNGDRPGHMSGRGGAGNFVPVPAESRGRSQHHTHGNPVDVVKKMFRSLSRSSGRKESP